VSVDGATDAWKRYRARAGYGDRRPWWASEDRELCAYAELSKGEQRARGLFHALTHPAAQAEPLEPEKALRQALGLDAGPIPDVQTQEAFDAYWSPDHVKSVAARWLASRLTRAYVPAEAHRARRRIEAAAPGAARVLIEIAHNPDVPAAARVRACTSILDRCKSMPAELGAAEMHELAKALPDDVKALERELAEIPTREKDLNRARLMIEVVRFRLKALAPEIYGDQLHLAVSHAPDLGQALAAARSRALPERRGAAIGEALRLEQDDEGGEPE
jgi:hypothetical protein